MKNKKICKRISALILVGCMLTASLVGCGKKQSTDTNTKEQTTSTDQTVNTSSEKNDVTEVKDSEPEVKEPVNFTYWCPLDVNSAASITSFNDMGIMKAADEICNTKIEYTHPAAGTESEQFNLKLASLEYEDIMEWNWSAYPGGPGQGIADGVIIDLAPYLDYAPNFKRILEENPDIARQITTNEGQIYCMPGIGLNSVNVTGGFLMRGDWLEELGLEAPETIEEWETVLTAFRDKFGTEAAFSGDAGHLFGGNAFFTGGFGIHATYFLENGKVQYGPIRDEYKDYLETMKRWYDEKLIDADIFANDSKTINNKILNNEAGAMFGFIGGTIGTLMTSAKDANPDPDFSLVGIPFLSQTKGEAPKFLKYSWECRTQNQAAITTACENIEAAISYLDFWYSEEGNLLKNFGVEGVSYEMVNDYPTYTDEILKNPDGLSIAQALGKHTRSSVPSIGVLDYRYYEQFYQIEEQIDAMNLWNADTSIVYETLLPSLSPSSEEAEELAAINVAIDTYAKEETTKFIMGLRDISEYESYVETLKGMGIDRALEIYQKAYEEYLAR